MYCMCSTLPGNDVMEVPVHESHQKSHTSYSYVPSFLCYTFIDHFLHRRSQCKSKMAAIAKGAGFLNNVVKSHTTHDHLNLTSSTSVRSVLGKYHEANTEAETVYFSDFIIKINPQGRPQERLLLISTRPSTTSCQTITRSASDASRYLRSGPCRFHKERRVCHSHPRRVRLPLDESTQARDYRRLFEGPLASH